MEHVSELRQDMVSGDWVVIATGRAKRPNDFLKQKREKFNQAIATCPFEKNTEKVLASYFREEDAEKDWWVVTLANKYPAFGNGTCSVTHPTGPYSWLEGVGYHEVVVSRDHERSLAQMTDEEADLVVRAYQDRFLELKNKECVAYVAIFHNHGKQSGASISHPHSQIISLPVVPPDIGRSVKGSKAYFQDHRECVHCVMLKYELRSGERLVYEDSAYAVVAPYASRTAFELRVFPKKHSAHFESMNTEDRKMFSRVLRLILAKLHQGLENPDYNFFLHTAPVGESREFEHYHWHLEILPKTSIWAGFEIGTGIEISVIAPEDSAKFLREVAI